MAEIQAVLFDMDGTLVDSTEAIEAIWSAWAVRNGIPVDEVLAWCHGRDVASTVIRFLPHLDAEAVQAMVAAQLDQECTQLDSVRPATGALELIAWLQAEQIPWGVVTNAPRRLARARLGAALVNPPVLVTLEDVIEGKPAPDGYARGAQLCGVAPARALAVEDSSAGLVAARAAGAVVVAVGGRTDADIVCRDLREVHRRLADVRPASKPRHGRS